MTRMQIALVLSVVSAATGAAAAPETPALAGAIAACQRAVQETLRDSRGIAAPPTFNSAPAAVPGPADASEITVRGAGQARAAGGPRPFSYSCSYDTRSDTVAGVVLRDAGASERGSAAQGVEPDLSQISPAACESAAAGALKQRWPGVGGISFSTETRQLSQPTRDRASLRGQGTATPSARDPATHFSYDCDIDPRNGRIVAVRIAH